MQTPEEFWEKYLNEDLLLFFDDAYEFFSHELPEGFMETYEVEELLVEVKGRQQDVKEYEKVLKFTSLIEAKHPQLYRDNFIYFDDFLIDYYCYHQDFEKAGAAFSNFIKYPLQDFDMYVQSFKKLLYYGHNEVLNTAVDKNFVEVHTTDRLLPNAASEMASFKAASVFGEAYSAYLQGQTFDANLFAEKLKGYNLKFDEEYLSVLKIAVENPLQIQTLEQMFKQNKALCFECIKIHYLKYMHGRGLAFEISDAVWAWVSRLWVREKKPVKSLDSFFTVGFERLEEFLVSLQSAIFIDMTSEMIAILWGSVSVYDFLFSAGIIKETTHKKFIEATAVLKGRAIVQNIRDLWESDFIHRWPKPDSVSEEEFLQESKIFQKSYAFKKLRIWEVKEEIEEELSKIGELAKHIAEGEKLDLREEKRLGALMSELLLEKEESKGREKEITSYTERIPLPFKEKKVGRNEPCTCGSGEKYKKCCGK